MNNLRWLTIDSFFAGLMLFGFLQSINDHKWFFTIIFAILFFVDSTKAKFEYRQVKNNLNN